MQRGKSINKHKITQIKHTLTQLRTDNTIQHTNTPT